MLQYLIRVMAIAALLVTTAPALAKSKKSGSGGAADIIVLYHPDCPLCLHEAEILPGIARQYPDISFTLVVLHDKGKDIRKPKMKTGANLRMQIPEEPGEDVMERYGNVFQALPYSVAFDKKGRACNQHYGLLGPETVGKWNQSC